MSDFRMILSIFREATELLTPWLLIVAVAMLRKEDKR